jgi:hypothetical protein
LFVEAKICGAVFNQATNFLEAAFI